MNEDKKTVEVEEKQLEHVIGGADDEAATPDCYTTNRRDRGLGVGNCAACAYFDTCKNSAKGKIDYPDQRPVN